MSHPPAIRGRTMTARQHVAQVFHKFAQHGVDGSACAHARPAPTRVPPPPAPGLPVLSWCSTVPHALFHVRVSRHASIGTGPPVGFDAPGGPL